ncbi:MAG: RHS repeat-associated core domain-containing protein, partial [Bacteroidota bacterium]
KACPDHSGFTGHFLESPMCRGRREGGLGIYHAQARMYDPATGRFWGVDAMRGVYPTINPYHYTFNNPVIYTDPTGNSVFEVHVSAQSTQFIMRGEVGFGFAIDHHGDMAFTFTAGGGPALGYGATVSAGATIYPAPSMRVDDLSGSSYSVGGYITAPGIGGLRAQGSKANPSLDSFSMSEGFDLSSIGGSLAYEYGAGIGVFGNNSSTTLLELGNIEDFGNRITSVIDSMKEYAQTLSGENQETFNQLIEILNNNEEVFHQFLEDYND